MYKDIGHLINIEKKGDELSFHLFLHPSYENSLPVYETVINKIRRITLTDSLKDKIEIKIYSVAEFHSLEEDHPSVDISTIYKVPVEVFFNRNTKIFKEQLFLTIIKNVASGFSSPFPKIHMNAVVTGTDFFDREEVVKQIWENLTANQNVLLCAPRRYGKTSLMRNLDATANNNGFTPVMIDLENIQTPEEFLAKIEVALEARDITDTEKEQRIRATVEVIEYNWQEEGHKFFSALDPSNGKLLFLLDECPYMLDTFLGKKQDTDYPTQETKERVNRFLEWFADIRETIKDRALFLLTGSVHLPTFLKDNELSPEHFTDFQTINLPYFEPNFCRDYVEAILLGMDVFIEDDRINKIVELNTPGIPYFIQITLMYVEDLYRKNPKFTVDDLEYIYEEKITGPDGRRHFDTFERHFKRYGPRRDSGAKAVLKELSQAGEEGLAKHRLKQTYDSINRLETSDFDIVIENLQYDFYIEKIQNTDQYRFQSRILKDYWRKNQRV